MSINYRELRFMIGPDGWKGSVNRVISSGTKTPDPPYSKKMNEIRSSI